MGEKQAVDHAGGRSVSDAERVKQIVLRFYEAALNEKDYEKASVFLGSTYTQHNPWVQDGPEGFKRFVEFLRSRYPDAHNEVKRAFVDGDHVILHVHSVRVPGTPGRAIVEIFRVLDGKVVEHWDVIQEMTEPLYPPLHDNGMF
jgi:predicted SnoaL-like aldol condensation-catalyzing enzyme